jgi:hypothetical protein
MFDKPWISSLRFIAPDDEDSRAKGSNASNGRPPAFFDDDLAKWRGKFEKSIKERNSFKTEMMKTQDFNISTKNLNF